MGNRRWTRAENDYLKDAWGNKSIRTICKHLNRTENAVKVHVVRLGLGAARDNNEEYITLNSLVTALYGKDCTNGSTYARDVLLPKIVKIYLIPQPKVPRKCVKLSEFWRAAEKNRAMFDFSQLEKYALGSEPKWVEEQRRLDAKSDILRRKPRTVWTPSEDALLKSMAAKKRYTCSELAAQFSRSEGAIVRRLNDFGMYGYLKREKAKHYSQEELDQLAKYIKQGWSYPLIAKQTGRSEKSLRGVVWQRLGTENLCKARAILKSVGRLEAKPRGHPKQGGDESEK